MLERVALAALLCTLWSCGSSSPGSDPGALVDNTQWVPTTDGEAFFGAPPADAECALMPIDCPEFPWPEGECVTLDATSTCVASFIPECDVFTVLSIYTRMPDSALIPSDGFFPSATWTATKDYPAGTPLLWHVDNHGSNEYQLLEVNVL